MVLLLEGIRVMSGKFRLEIKVLSGLGVFGLGKSILFWNVGIFVRV